MTDLGSSAPIATFFSGVFMATFAASGVFFLKFWRASRDRFFLLFSIACWLIALERVVLQFFSEAPMLGVNEQHYWVYLIRLSAFFIIFIAILDKNRSKKNNTI